MISGVARDNDGQVTRVEITMLTLRVESIKQRSKSNHHSSQMVHGSHTRIPNLIHDQQYEVQARAYDGVDYSMMETVRVIIDNPADADNIKPTFNPTGWVDTITIFCDEKSSAFDKCGVGAEINH